jgi:hypothetical protein
VQIKAQGLLNAARYIEDEFGVDALRDVIRGCSPATRDRYTSVIAIDWHPVDELLDFLENAERVCGMGHLRGKVSEGIGAAGARANMRGTLVRLAVWISRPEQMMKRVANMWSNYNDEGVMNLLEVGDTISRLELVGLKRTHPLFCALLTGWCREVALAIRTSVPIAKHIECRARGDARCTWEVRYASIATKEPGSGTPGSGVPPISG